jgi:hypothetical protein
MNSPLGLWLKQAGNSTGALAQAMRNGEPKFWYEIFAQTHFRKARQDTKPGFGASEKSRWV